MSQNIDLALWRDEAAWKDMWETALADRTRYTYVPPEIDFASHQVVVASFSLNRHVRSCRIVDMRQRGAVLRVIVEHITTDDKVPAAIWTCFHAVVTPQVPGVPRLEVRRISGDAP